MLVVELLPKERHTQQLLRFFFFFFFAEGRRSRGLPITRHAFAQSLRLYRQARNDGRRDAQV